MEKLIFTAQIAATLFMTGVIWVVQLAQYPLFSFVGTEKFTDYHDAYRFRITWIVAPAMLVELVTAGLLIFFPPPEIDPKILWAGFALVLVNWASTFFLQVPLHERLAAGFDPAAHRALVRTNRVRTAGWSLRGLLMIWILWQTLRF
ncbi:MAG: hypothetical protein JSS81_10815 [Acidobacteria bacterium]|nr:hypothetical protein [Acidobacteriota bacterium]